MTTELHVELYSRTIEYFALRWGLLLKTDRLERDDPTGGLSWVRSNRRGLMIQVLAWSRPSGGFASWSHFCPDLDRDEKGALAVASGWVSLQLSRRSPSTRRSSLKSCTSRSLIFDFCFLTSDFFGRKHSFLATQGYRTALFSLWSWGDTSGLFCLRAGRSRHGPEAQLKCSSFMGWGALDVKLCQV